MATRRLVAAAPREIVDVGVRAARLIGRGLYGVDIKANERGVFVIEVNDNPNLVHDVEDAAEATRPGAGWPAGSSAPATRAGPNRARGGQGGLTVPPGRRQRQERQGGEQQGRHGRDPPVAANRQGQASVVRSERPAPMNSVADIAPR